MANYFVINNKFRPYSFDELIKPYQMYGEAYKEQEAALDAAAAKEFSPDYLDQNLDSKAYNMYNNATTGLKNISDELAASGLSTGLKSRLKSTAKDYSRTMTALNDAQDRLNAERERRAKLGDDYVYQQDDLRIGDFLNGATPNQKSASLSGITKDIATDFATRAKSITRDTWNKVLDQNGKVVGGYYDVTTEAGLTAAQLDSILTDDDTWSRMMRNPGISREEKDNLQRFRDSIISKKNAIGYDNYSKEGQSSIDDAILRGASAGLGSVTHKYEADRGYNPLGWAQYYDSKADQLLKLQLQYPQYQFDSDGRPKRDKDGNIVLTKGWTQNSTGKWIGPNGETTGTPSSGSSTDYTITTPEVTVHTKKGTTTYSDWNKVREADIFKNGDLQTVAIKDITDPDIQRAILNRINVSNVNVEDKDLSPLIMENLPQLNQLTVQIAGNKGDRNYEWVISDKKVQRLTETEAQNIYNNKKIGIE